MVKLYGDSILISGFYPKSHIGIKAEISDETHWLTVAPIIRVGDEVYTALKATFRNGAPTSWVEGKEVYFWREDSDSNALLVLPEQGATAGKRTAIYP